ncbi:TauD/TfdA family dioxygenase [Actinomadura algeriensis]|uniref:Alpha-ketoglutarate-dependent taurine dioxygenase n=1 Tax=Actinomadura algeriensis TaxID=1679523 RepID=A0ABR9JJM5_9ACTN|nr:TauD/TfdA family dioxygenase [Actinomadura algeriensis]MBE1530654.1 alpha-ketoglutarate-dependent taurine dioxygenase [Actinomadura algeriensis]
MHPSETHATDTGRAWRPHEITAGAAGPPDLAGRLDALGADGLTGLLAEHKALVFRGFGVPPEAVEPVLDRLVPDRLPYVHGNSPRTKVGGNLYTSTEYPRQYTISMHNELSYAHRWPARLAFYCETAPGGGGATTVADGARWLGSLDGEVRDAFAGGVRYVQNLHGGFGFGKSWQDTFETDDRAAVEAYLADARAEWEWGPDGLRVTQLRPSTIEHPVTGAEVWFNQADQWHPAGLGTETSAELYDILPPDEFPQYVTFADGSPIPDEHVRHILDRGLDAAIDVDWHAGDLLLIDNVAVAHGRRPFEGSRRVLVAMSHG